MANQTGDMRDRSERRHHNTVPTMLMLTGRVLGNILGSVPTVTMVLHVCLNGAVYVSITEMWYLFFQLTHLRRLWAGSLTQNTSCRSS